MFPEFFIFTLGSIYLGCPHTLAIVNNAARNTKTQTSLWDSVFICFG